jgi:hypothetical protein
MEHQKLWIRWRRIMVMCEKTARPILCNLQQFNMPKKQHFEKNSHVGLCNPPSGSLCLTFREMAESLHEQSARETILNSNRPKPQRIAAWIVKKSLLGNPHKETSGGD